MATIDALPTGPKVASAPKPTWLRSNWGVLLAVAALVAVLWLPTPEGLSIAGQRMLAILAFAVIVWMTEALDYAVSAIVIATLMAFLLGLSPNPANPKVLLGTNAGLALAFSGFANTALALVASALFLAAAMTATGLDKRIALAITSRVACLVPITLGIISAFGVNKRGAFAGMLMITTVQTASIWNVGIKTAAAQNMVAVGFIEKTLQKSITWLEWFIAAAPFGILMSIALYFVMTRMMPAEVREISGGREQIEKSLAELGPMKTSEKKLLAISLTLLLFWATEGVLHSFDTSSTTIAAVALMFLPGIGLKNVTALFVLAVLTLFLTLIHLGFASATALASAMIPIVIAVLQGVATPGINIVGMTMLLQFVVSFGFILVVNAPQNMLAYGTETFEAKDFVRTGLVLTVIALALVMLLGTTYWRWLGYV